MNWQRGSMSLCILAAIGLIQRLGIAQSPASEIKDEFQMNVMIAGSDKVTYSRNFNRHREFSYAICSGTVSKFCNVSVIVASKPLSGKTCRFELDPYEATELGVAALLLPDDEHPRDMVAVEWYRVGPYDHLDSFMAFLTMADCKNNAHHFVGSIDETKGSPTHAIAYRYPRIRTSARMRHGRRLIKEYAFGQARQRGGNGSANVRYIRTNHAWLGEEQPVELAASQGFFFVAANQSTVDVMYANLTTEETQLLGSIGGAYPKTSGAHGRYGLCWKKRERDSRVNCTQFLASGQRSVGPASLELPESVDWLAVHNLRESGMLLVTGQCDAGRCDGFGVTRLHADGRTSGPLQVGNLNATCPRRPAYLSMDVTEAGSTGELVCFHFVCLEHRYSAGPSVERTGASLQYRRKCLEQGQLAALDFSRRCVSIGPNSKR